MPAAAVTPAPIANIRVVAVKKLVVEFPVVIDRPFCPFVAIVFDVLRQPSCACFFECVLVYCKKTGVFKAFLVKGTY